MTLVISSPSISTNGVFHSNFHIIPTLLAILMYLITAFSVYFTLKIILQRVMIHEASCKDDLPVLP